MFIEIVKRDQLYKIALLLLYFCRVKNKMVKNRSIFIFLMLLKSGTAINLFLLDDAAGVGRTFDGIGGLSGGSVSKLIIIGIIIIDFVISWSIIYFLL